MCGELPRRGRGRQLAGGRSAAAGELAGPASPVPGYVLSLTVAGLVALVALAAGRRLPRCDVSGLSKASSAPYAWLGMCGGSAQARRAVRLVGFQGG